MVRCTPPPGIHPITNAELLVRNNTFRHDRVRWPGE